MVRKVLISAIITALVFFIIVIFFQVFPQMKSDSPSEGDNILVIVWGIVIVTFFVSMNNIKGKSGTDIASDVFNTVKEAKDNIQASIDSKSTDFYAIAEEEYENGEIDKGSWSQALVKANGNESLRKVEYMKLRVMQLKRKS